MSNTFTAQGLADFYQKVADGGEAQLKIDEEWANLFVGGPSLGSSNAKWRIKPTEKVAKTLEQLEKELTEAYKDNEDSYSRGYGHMYQSKIQELEDEIAALVKPTKKVIDLSVLIESGIDCEFSEGISWFFSTLKHHSNGVYMDVTSSVWDKCRPRMNHKHAWPEGECPLPEGFAVKVWFRSGGHTVVTTRSGNYWGINGDTMCFEVLRVADGYVMPWEQDNA